MVEISVQSSGVWDYFQKNRQKLKTHMHQIARELDYGIEIFVTEESGCPSIVVTADDSQIYEEVVVDEKDCEETVAKVYNRYLTHNSILSTMIGDEDEEYEEGQMSELEIQETIEDRELELDDAVYAFLASAVGSYYDTDIANKNIDDIVDDLKEHFLEYIARKHNLPVYRPMFLEFEDGVEELCEYPYENMEFEDDNPIYK